MAQPQAFDTDLHPSAGGRKITATLEKIRVFCSLTPVNRGIGDDCPTRPEAGA